MNLHPFPTLTLLSAINFPASKGYILMKLITVPKVHE